MKKLISLIFLILPIVLNAQHNESSFAIIDAHARSAPYYSNPEKLVNYLVKPCKTEWQKTRTIFIWITDNIAYDDYTHHHGTVTLEKCQALNVYRSKKGVCEGYANLFQMLCGFAEIYCMKVNGYGKGVGHYKNEVYTKTNHSWNICEINDEIHLFDITWATGHNTYGHFIKSYNEFWWDTPPELFITTHYSENMEWNNLAYPVTKSQFECMTEIFVSPKANK